MVSVSDAFLFLSLDIWSWISFAVIGASKISSVIVVVWSGLFGNMTFAFVSWDSSYKRFWKCFIQSSDEISQLSSTVSFLRILFISFQNSPLRLEFKLFISFKSWFLYVLYNFFTSVLYFFLRVKYSCRSDRGAVGFISFASFCSFFFSCLQVLSYYGLCFFVHFRVLGDVSRLSFAADFKKY